MSQVKTMRVGVIGTGAISGAYLGMAAKFPIIQMAACADLDLDRANKAAKQFDVPKVCSVDELLADPSIEIVLNLTVPKAHVPISLRAIESGKHVYCEKPLGVTREEAMKLVEAANRKKLRVGCAPDTFLGAGIQTARKLIDDGAIGKPVAFTAFMMGRGHEHWHPSPEFYYQVGGGPMLDMGPYYITALLQLLGPIRRVCGFTSTSRTERPILSQPKFGQVMKVETPDHYAGSIEFDGGCVGTIVQSFAMRAAEYDGRNPITIYGTDGTIKVPDPNGFDGPVFLCRFNDTPGAKDEFLEQAHTFVKGYQRSVGLADMASAIRVGRAHRCSLEQAFTALDVMQAFSESSSAGRAIEIKRGYQRSTAMNPELEFGKLD